MTAIRIAKEFDLRITIEHCTEGHLIVEALQAAGVPVAVGPTLGNASKLELLNKSWTTPGILAAAGIPVSIITDALQAITNNPARHVGVADRVGSREAGQDVDLVLTDGDPLVSDTVVRYVVVDGRVLIGHDGR